MPAPEAPTLPDTICGIPIDQLSDSDLELVSFASVRAEFDDRSPVSFHRDIKNGVFPAPAKIGKGRNSNKWFRIQIREHKRKLLREAIARQKQIVSESKKAVT